MKILKNEIDYLEKEHEEILSFCDKMEEKCLEILRGNVDTETEKQNERHRDDGQQAQEQSPGQTAPCSLRRKQPLRLPASRTERDPFSVV